MDFKPSIPSYGGQEYPIAIFGEAPGEQEIMEGLPFVGRSGKLLFSTIEEFGCRRDMFYVSNIFWERPPMNRVDWFFTSKPETNFKLRNGYLKRKHLHHMERLEREVSSHGIRFVLLVGATAVWGFTGWEKFSITEIVGEIIETKFEGTYGMPIFHPSYVLRKRGGPVEKKFRDLLKIFYTICLDTINPS